MAGVLQLVLLVSVGLLAYAAISLVVELIRLAVHRSRQRHLVTLAGFHAGALMIGWIGWLTLKPAGWTLSFWTTVQAGVDSETYGHAVEHAAEVLAANVVVLAAMGGLVAAATLTSYLYRRPVFRSRQL